MDSINEQFHQVYNSKYNLPHYEAKKTAFSKAEYYTYALEQHKILEKTVETVETVETVTARQNRQHITIFLVREITDQILARYEKVAQTLQTPVYLLTDSFYPKHKVGQLNIIYFFENIVYDAGYFYVNTDVMPDKLVITWDRCLFFLGQYPDLFEYAWIIEDDVALRGKDTLARLMKLYETSQADLLAAPPKINEADPGEWPLWPALRDSGLPKLWASYNPLIRVSRKFILEIKSFVAEKKRLFFLEIFFVSLAMARGLKIEIFKELLNEHYRYTPDITFEETQKSWNFSIFHPVKNCELWDRIWMSGEQSGEHSGSADQ